MARQPSDAHSRGNVLNGAIADNARAAFALAVAMATSDHAVVAIRTTPAAGPTPKRGVADLMKRRTRTRIAGAGVAGSRGWTSKPTAHGEGTTAAPIDTEVAVAGRRAIVDSCRLAAM